MDESSLEKLAAQFRAMQLFAHIGHNKVSGPTFFEDHEFLGGLYGTYEGIYDDLVERLIGLGESPDLMQINDEANAELQAEDQSGSIVSYLTRLLEWERVACDTVEDLAENGDLSQATLNLVIQIADDSEKRQYKMRQRLGESRMVEKPDVALDRLATEKMGARE